MATYTEKLEERNLALRMSLQDAINWIVIDNGLTESYEIQKTASETIENLQTTLDLSEIIFDADQIDLFENTEDKAIINEFDVKATLIGLSKRLTSISNVTSSITKESLIFTLDKSKIILTELTQELIDKRLKR